MIVQPPAALPYTGPRVEDYTALYGGVGQHGAAIITVNGVTTVYTYTGNDQTITVP